MEEGDVLQEATIVCALRVPPACEPNRHHHCDCACFSVMSIVYALIARQQSVLCEYTDKSGNFPTVTRVMLKHIAAQQLTGETPESKSVFPYNDFNFFFLHDDGLAYMCMAEERVQTNVAFSLLVELKTAFVAQYGAQGKSAIAFGMMPFVPTLEGLMKKYDNFKIETPLTQVRGTALLAHVCVCSWLVATESCCEGGWLTGAAEDGESQDDHD